MQRVILLGDMGQRFGETWDMHVDYMKDIFKLIGCQRKGFKEYLMKCHENGTDFTIRRGKDFIEDQESTDSVDPILDFNELDIDYLAEENLGEEGLEFTELDYDALNVNFLEDLLDIISELDKIDDEAQLAQVATSTNIKGTLVGQDTKTQITTIVTGEKIKMTRAVGSSAAINIDSDNSYTVVLEQNGVVNEVKVNGGSSSTIVIRQSSG